MPRLPKVTAAERRAANDKARAIARIERRSLIEAAKLTARIASGVLSGFRKGRDPSTVLQNELRLIVPESAGLMVVGHLTGAEMIAKRALGLRLAAQDAAVRAMQKRLEMSDEQVADLASVYSEKVAGMVAELSAHGSTVLDETLQTIVREGMHVRQGMAALREGLTTAGIIGPGGAPGYMIEGMYRTQVQTAYNAGQWQTAQDPAIDEILWGYKYVTVGDDRVRAEHLGLEGVTAPKDDAIWDRIYTPNGWNCRCAIIEIFSPREIALPPDEFEDPFTGEIVTPGPDPGFEVNFGKIIGGGGAFSPPALSPATA